MKNAVMTVLGEVSAGELGFCQCHEHIMLSRGQSFLVDPQLCIDDLAKSAAEVKRFYEKGGRTIVDAQPGGCNRVAEALAAISIHTGVNIIASTGFHKSLFYPDTHWLFKKTEAELTEIFTAELITGMYTNTDTVFSDEQCTSRAGIIKSALDSCNLDERYKKLFSAAANSALSTGAPILVHIEKGSDPELLLGFFCDRGIKPERLIFCHMDRACPDLNVHRRVLKQGVFLEFDTIGRFNHHSDEYEASLFKSLIDDGFEDQLLFSLDTTGKRLKTYVPDAVGLDYILCVFLDKMRLAGISENQLFKISNANPKHALTWK